MRLTILGGGGAWPTTARGCSGYLLTTADGTLLIDPGYATLPVLLEHTPAAAIDAVLLTHSHGDHCADLNPLLRARHLAEDPPPPLPVFALPGTAAAVLELDADMLRGDYDLREFTAGDTVHMGPFQVATRPLAHFVPNVGLRVTAGAATLAYTGDGGADPGVPALAESANLLLAEASFAHQVPEHSRGNLADARTAGAHAAAAHVDQLLLTHLWPGTRPAAALTTARQTFDGPTDVATPGLLRNVGEPNADTSHRKDADNGPTPGI